MKILLRIGLCCLLSGGLYAQRGGGGHGGGGGGSHGGGSMSGGVRGGGIVGSGVRGGYGGYGYGYGRGFYGRGLYSGYWPGFYGWGAGLGYWNDPYYGYWDDPYYSNYSPSTYPSYTSQYAAPAEYNPSPNVTVFYPGAQQTYTAPVQPVIRSYDQYGQQVQPQDSSAWSNGGSNGEPSSGSPIYLIATKDQAIRAAAAYWVDGRTLHYVTLQHEEKQLPLDSVDRNFSLQLNRERRVAFQLPQ